MKQLGLRVLSVSFTKSDCIRLKKLISDLALEERGVQNEPFPVLRWGLRMIITRTLHMYATSSRRMHTNCHSDVFTEERENLHFIP